MSKHRKVEKPCVECSEKFIGRVEAKYCPGCRTECRRRNLEKPKKYQWTPERDEYVRRHYDGRVKGRAQEIATTFGWPCWVIKRRAGELGLSYQLDRKQWTEEEEKLLWTYAGQRNISWFVKKLKRSTTSVVLKLKRMKIRRAWSEGFTLSDLELCFGIDHHGIERWVREGKLKIKRRGTDRPLDPWYVTDEQILDFIKNYPMDFRLDKVDQLWFMNLLLDGDLFGQTLHRKKNMDAA